MRAFGCITAAVLTGLSAATLAQDEIPAQYQATDQQALDLMDQQKAELCSPPGTGMETTCQQMEQGRQILLARMRGEDNPAVAASFAQTAPSQSEIVDMARSQVEQMCGAGGDASTCEMARRNLQLAQQMQSNSTSTDAPSSSANLRAASRPAAVTRQATALDPSKPYPGSGSETFGQLPADAGSDAQRAFWQRVCQRQTFRLDSPKAKACEQNYRILTGQEKVPGIVAGHPTAPAASPAPNVGHVTANGNTGGQSGSGHGGISVPINPTTHQPCITSLGQITKQHGADTHYTIRFANSCNITASVEALAISQKPNDWRSNGVGPGGQTEIVCIGGPGWGVGSCSGFSRYRIIYGG